MLSNLKQIARINNCLPENIWPQTFAHVSALFGEAERSRTPCTTPKVNVVANNDPLTLISWLTFPSKCLQDRQLVACQ
jgi:hypothetical protein